MRGLACGVTLSNAANTRGLPAETAPLDWHNEMITRGTSFREVRLGLHALAFIMVVTTCWADDESSRYAKLVERLVSTNKPPAGMSPEDRPRASLPAFPDDGTRRAHEKVIDATNELIKAGRPAFPVLIGHLRDERYSLTCDLYGNGFSNRSVADLCWFSLWIQLDIYQDQIDGSLDAAARLSTFSYIRYHIDQEHREEWLRRYNDVPLWEIQVDVLSWLLDSSDKLLSIEGMEDMEIDKVRLEQIKKTIKQTHEPILPDVYLETDGNIYSTKVFDPDTSDD